LHQLENQVKSIRMLENINETVEIQNDFRSSALEERIEQILYISAAIEALYLEYIRTLNTIDLDSILTAKINLQNFLLQNETHITFNSSVLEQVFAPVFLELPPDDPALLEARIRQLRIQIDLTPEYDLGNVPNAFPTEGTISSHYGLRNDPFTGQPAFHTGLDIAAPEGTPVYAWFSGVVREADYVSGWGLQVVTVQDSVMLRYAHLSKVYVQSGQKVKQGDLIGEIGSTGRSTGPHLHLGLYINNIAVNPYYVIHGR